MRRIKTGLKLFAFLAITFSTSIPAVIFFYGWLKGEYSEVYAWIAIILGFLCLLNAIFFEKLTGSIFKESSIDS